MPEPSSSTARGAGTWTRPSGALRGLSRDLPPGTQEQFGIVSEAHTIEVATEWEPHAHPAHELLWVRRGTLTARIGDRVFTISEGYGLWIPAGELHAGRLTAGVELFDAFFSATRTSVPFPTATIVTMVPILQSLLTHLRRTDLTPDARSRAEGVVFDVLDPAPAQLAVRVPSDPHIAPIAHSLLRDPTDERSIEDWSRETGVSTRTITRTFRVRTGLSFAQWRQVVRIHHAIELLASGSTVQDISDQLGYAHAGSFIAAFRRVMDTTPGAFLPSGETRGAPPGDLDTL